ncbi:MAG TPA: hypothetical protein VNN76_11265 [Bacteroidota bacterium]|nr:hypothetical protein [Bacteroidota bacterium]
MKVIFTLLLATAVLPTLSVSQERRQDQREETEWQSRDFGDRLSDFIEDLVDEFGREPFESEDWGSDTLQERRTKETHSFSGNTTIENDQVIDGDVVVKGGDLTIFGEVDGDVLVVGGTLYVKEGGRVKGNARVIRGDIVRDEGGIIEGYMDKTRTARASVNDDVRRLRRTAYTLQTPWIPETANLDNFIFRYNRVEGLFLGLGSEKKYYWDGFRNYNVYGSVGYGFKLHRWRYHLGVTRQFAIISDEPGSGELIEIGIEGHSLTDSKDEWLINVHENTAAALLIHEDFRDYYGRDGYTIHGAYTAQDNGTIWQVKAEYLIDRYKSLEKETEYAFFGGRKTFRPNPAIDEGRMRSAIATAGLSTYAKTISGPEGWSIYGTAEFSEPSWGGEFNFRQFVADIRRYQPLGRYDNFNLRLRVGTSEGLLPRQRMFEIGGLGTLHAYRFKSDAGNRLVLANAEYILNGDFLHDLDFWPSWLMRGINFLFMADAGWVTTADSLASWSEGFETLHFSSFKTNLGFGFANKSGAFRIGFAWRTDVKAPVVFFIRFTRPF